MGLSTDDSERLRELELTLWRAATRFDSQHMERVLAPDFTEFGRSGRVYARADTLAVPAQPIDAELDEMSMREIAADVVIVTYRSHVRAGDEVLVGNRSSVWSRDHGEWRLHFHQGTPVADTSQLR